MNGTPRTDQMEQHAPVGLRRNSAFEQASDLCRQLERELNAANAEIERLTNKVAQLYEGAEEQKQRIKQLESKLDELHDLEKWLEGR